MDYELNFEAEPFGGRGRGEGPDNEGFLGHPGGFFKAASAQAPAAQIIDRTAFGTKSHRKGTRDINTLTALVLHQTAFSRGNAADKYDNIPVHFVITPDGKIVQLHPLPAYLWSSNDLNPRSVAVEFVGNFRDVRGNFYKPEEFGCHALTQAQIDAGRELIKYLKTRMPKFQHVLAHRQSSDQRDNDPGPEVWYHVGQWALDNLGLKDGGPNFSVGTGKPIPQEWRSWGRLAASRPVPASSSKRCRGGYSGELAGYRAEFEGEGPLGNTDCAQRCRESFERCVRAFTRDPLQGMRCIASLQNCLRGCDFTPPRQIPPQQIPPQQRPTLRRGSSGPAVADAQVRLNRWLARRPRVGLPPLVVDGRFGPKTDATVRAFQRAHGLQADGVIGPNTWGRLLNF